MRYKYWLLYVGMRHSNGVYPRHGYTESKRHHIFALSHFATEIDASTFYHVYCLQKKVVCLRLEGVTVNPSLIGNQPVIYNSFQVQPRIISSTRILCRCPPNNTDNTNSNTSTTNSKNTSADPLALTTTTANTNSSPASSTPSNNTDNTNSNTSTTNSNNSHLDTTINANATGLNDNDWHGDIENAKLKIRNLIKRKSEEIATLQKRSRVLEQQL